MADNPWPGGIADQTWWFGEQCLLMGGISGGIYADKPGFHNTVNRNLQAYPGNYSVALPILVAGPRDKARAFDWTFPEAKTHNYFRISQYSQRIMDASLARDPRLTGLYEWFGTKDGANIGYNVYKNRPSSSDDTHDWHMHFSWVTAWLLDWAGPHGVISVLRNESLSAYLARGGKLIGREIDMTYDQADRNVATADTWRLFTILANKDTAQYQLTGEPAPRNEPNLLKAALEEILEEVKAPVSVVLSDEQLDRLADMVAVRLQSGVLRPLANAAQAEADSLNAAAGE